MTCGPVVLAPHTHLGMVSSDPLTTPDGRYLVVRGRLWRKTNPALDEQARACWTRRLMDARRALRGTPSEEARDAARAPVERAKRALGESGPVWWTDGAPDFNRCLVKNTPYAAWFASLTGGPPLP